MELLQFLPPPPSSRLPLLHSSSDSFLASWKIRACTGVTTWREQWTYGLATSKGANPHIGLRLFHGKANHEVLRIQQARVVHFFSCVRVKEHVSWGHCRMSSQVPVLPASVLTTLSPLPEMKAQSEVPCTLQKIQRCAQPSIVGGVWLHSKQQECMLLLTLLDKISTQANLIQLSDP